MYSFKDTTTRLTDETALPSVAMLFNGKLIENEIDGYRTLNVSGREALSYDLETSGKISGRDGEPLLNKTLPARTIKVQYRMEAASNEEFQQKFRLLNYLLHTSGDVPIVFKDDLDVMYYGQTASMNDVPPETNTVISTFEIYCADPYRYETAQVFTGNPASVVLSSPYDTVPDEVKITLAGSAIQIAIANINTGKHIILNGSYTSGDVIIINIAENKITKNGQNIMNNLDYTDSDFHRFMVKPGDVVQVVPSNAALSITVRGRWK